MMRFSHSSIRQPLASLEFADAWSDRAGAFCKRDSHLWESLLPLVLRPEIAQPTHSIYYSVLSSMVLSQKNPRKT